MIRALICMICWHTQSWCDSRILFEQAKTHFDNKQYELCHESISKALRATQDTAQKLSMGNFLLNIANLYYIDGHIKKALSIFQELHDLFPFSHSILYSLGLCFNELAQYTKARDAFKKALYRKPNEIDIQQS